MELCKKNGREDLPVRLRNTCDTVKQLLDKTSPYMVDKSTYPKGCKRIKKEDIRRLKAITDTLIASLDELLAHLKGHLHRNRAEGPTRIGGNVYTDIAGYKALENDIEEVEQSHAKVHWSDEQNDRAQPDPEVEEWWNEFS